MNFAFHDLTLSVAGKDSITDCNAYELKQLVSHYPFFGPAHLLLARKMKEEELNGADQQIQKASLYFSNPLWFEHLLHFNEVEARPEPFEEAIEKSDPLYAEMEKPTTYEEVVIQNNLQREPVVITETDDSETLSEENIPPLPALRLETLKDTGNMDLIFEPYHTVDYFASQGIKAKEEEKPKDRFSQQLRSFTDWLKTIKKVPAGEVTDKANVHEDKKVEQMAEVSITDREVVTEAMAEVWEKQGNHDKAVVIYQKLSLLDPSKSSYFAAKIDQLKHS